MFSRVTRSRVSSFRGDRYRDIGLHLKETTKEPNDTHEDQPSRVIFGEITMSKGLSCG